MKNMTIKSGLAAALLIGGAVAVIPSSQNLEAQGIGLRKLDQMLTPTDKTIARGSKVFANNCSSCHGDDGAGDRSMGAPNLSDAIWLYGGSFDAIKETVQNSRYGMMPPMGGADLTEAEIRAVAIYVHGLGGGEATTD